MSGFSAQRCLMFYNFDVGGALEIEPFAYSSTLPFFMILRTLRSFLKYFSALLVSMQFPQAQFFS